MRGKTSGDECEGWGGLLLTDKAAAQLIELVDSGQTRLRVFLLEC